MSFKREGKDSAMDGVAMKKRVSELLTESITPSEVLITRSGKLCCLVCPHRPVLDTIPMLTVHRAGKRHKEVEATQSSTSAWGTKTLGAGVCKKGISFGKRIRLNLSSNPKHMRRMLKAPQVILDPGDPKLNSDFSGQLKSFQSADGSHGNHCIQPLPSSHSSLSHDRVFITSESTSSDGIAARRCTQSSVPDRVVGSSQGCIATEGESVKIPASNIRGKKHLDPGAAARAKEMLKLRGSGWIKDWSGNWVKEDGVEFDSDEEQPIL